MMLQKWDEKKHEYLPFDVPDDRIVLLYTQDMSTPIDCTNCGKRMTYGDGFTSQTIHTEMGLGYPVCEACYEVETKNRQEAKR